MGPDEQASESEKEPLLDGRSTGNDDTYTDRDRWHDGVWTYAVGPEDIVVEGVLYDGTQWERDGEGGVRPRLRSEEEIVQRERDEWARQQFLEERYAESFDYDDMDIE